MRYLKPLNLFRDLLETKALERGRLLGLDVGDRYVGLAVSNPQNKIASPLRSLNFLWRASLLAILLTDNGPFLMLSM